jgi:hypothetical protein
MARHSPRTAKIEARARRSGRSAPAPGDRGRGASSRGGHALPGKCIRLLLALTSRFSSAAGQRPCVRPPTAPFCRRRPPPLPAWATSPVLLAIWAGLQEGVRACASVSSNGSASNVLPRSWLKRQTTPRPPKTRPSRRPPSAALAGPRTIAALDMGGQTITPRPVTADFINKCFKIVAGALVWRERPASHFPYRAGDRAIFNARFAGIRPAFAWRVSCQTFSWLASCMHRADRLGTPACSVRTWLSPPTSAKSGGCSRLCSSATRKAGICLRMINGRNAQKAAIRRPLAERIRIDPKRHCPNPS